MDPIAAFTAAIAPHIRLEHELIGGGMARVFVGEDLRLGRRVVVKILSPERAAALDRARFAREIETIARLQHPNIVPILWSGEEAGLPFFVMPFVSGRSLRVRLQQDGALAPAQAIPILRDVARALGAAHQAGIVHRDIKPDNVLLTPDGAAMVSDFGIAKLLSTDSVTAAHAVGPHATTAGTSLGTPTYMAPEQAAADPETDHRVDLYAFGVVAYEMLAGSPPFRDDRPQALMAAHIARAPEPLDVRVPLVPPELATMVMRCLEKAPADRFASASDIVALLDITTSSGHRVAPQVVRRRRRLLWGAAAIVLVAAGVLAMKLLRRPPLDGGLVAVAPFRVVLPDSSFAYLRDGLPDLLAAASLTGEGGPRAVEPRTALAAFRGAADGGDAGALPLAAALATARSLGAARLLLGEVLPTRDGIELVVTVHDVAARRADAPIRVSGSRDSLPALVEALGGKLLTALAGEGVQRSAGLGAVPLPALRAYLEGRALLGRMDAEAAGAAYLRAIALDSTFALAGIGAALAAGWNGANATREAGLAVAYANRDKLGGKDQALLNALLGPRYPSEGLVDSHDRIGTAEAYVAAAPERADAWYMLGDVYFHWGTFLDELDPMDRAAEHFLRALAIDSTYVPGYTHLVEIAILRGDDTLLTKVRRLQKAAGIEGVARVDRWLQARVADDQAAVDRIFAEPIQNSGFYHSVVDYGDYGGVGGDDVWRATQMALERTITPADRQNFLPFATRTAIQLGRLADAERYLAEMATTDPLGAARMRLLIPVLTGVESPAADAARAEIDAAVAAPGTRRTVRRLLARTLLLDAIAHDRRDRGAALLALVAPLERPEVGDTVARPGPIPLLAKAWLDGGATGPTAAQLAPVDSAMRHLRTNSDPMTSAATSVLLIGYHGRRGDHRAAMIAAFRRTTRNGDLGWTSSVLRRLAGIHGAAAGDTVHARLALTGYLAWRRQADPSLHAERADATKLLISLGGPLTIRDRARAASR